MNMSDNAPDELIGVCEIHEIPTLTKPIRCGCDSSVLSTFIRKDKAFEILMKEWKANVSSMKRLAGKRSLMFMLEGIEDRIRRNTKRLEGGSRNE